MYGQRGLKVPPIVLFDLMYHCIALKLSYLHCIQGDQLAQECCKAYGKGFVPVLPNMVLKAIELYRNKIQ